MAPAARGRNWMPELPNNDLKLNMNFTPAVDDFFLKAKLFNRRNWMPELLARTFARTF